MGGKFKPYAFDNFSIDKEEDLTALAAARHQKAHFIADNAVAPDPDALWDGEETNIPLNPAEDALDNTQEEEESEEETVSLTLSMLEQIKEQAFLDGQAQARTELEAALQGQQKDQQTQILHSITTQMQNILANEEQRQATSCRQAIRAAMATIENLLPAWLEKEGAHEIENLVKQTLEQQFDTKRMAIRLPDGMYDDLVHQLQAIAKNTGYEGKLIILSDDRLKDNDAVIEWADGGIDRRPAAQFATIQEQAETYLHETESVQAKTDHAPPSPAIEADPGQSKQIPAGLAEDASDQEQMAMAQQTPPDTDIHQTHVTDTSIPEAEGAIS